MVPLDRLTVEYIVENAVNKKEMLLMILTGTAGSGKSFTVYAMSTFLNGIIKRAAPTAKAAFLIKGETLHALLDLYTNPSDTYMPLKGDKLQRVQKRFKNIKFLIIDEFSMVDQNMFGYRHIC